jgi:hypothetical protein
MPVISPATNDPAAAQLSTSTSQETSGQASRAGRARRVPARPPVRATDDEILGLSPPERRTSVDIQHAVPVGRATADPADGRAVPLQEDGDTVSENESAARNTAANEPANLRAAFDANPELRRAWQDAQAYRETFATPEEARNATALLADLDRMDALFFSRRPEDHAELARAVAGLDPEAFSSLAQAMNRLAPEARNNSASSAPSSSGPEREIPRPQERTRNDHAQERPPDRRLVEPGRSAGPAPAQIEFFHATNAVAVQGVLDAIESQVERLLPEGASKSARNRAVGEIYRELDTTLRSNRQLAQQMRDAFRSGGLDADHQRAIVSLIIGRARQALPCVAKRVLSEWTSTIVAANQDRRARQRAAERRVVIAGSGGAGNDGQRSMTPRDIDYARMSDSDILNL